MLWDGMRNEKGRMERMEGEREGRGSETVMNYTEIHIHLNNTDTSIIVHEPEQILVPLGVAKAIIYQIKAYHK